jgi:hypothetical protein
MTKVYVDYIDPVESSFIDEIGFLFSPGGNSGTTFVVINGDAYAYPHVPWESYEALRDAASVGSEYHDFSKAFGPSRNTAPDVELEELDEALRVTAPAPVSDDQETLTFENAAEETGNEEAEVFEFPGTYVEGDVLNVNYSAQDNDYLLRETSLQLAVMLLSSRKNVNSSLVIEYAAEFAEYLRDG